uniref:Uncharacterized protein n=1 Tax=Fagus sylvatica TaxID=28930 RepID=A0A2N9H053_FAGSY
MQAESQGSQTAHRSQGTICPNHSFKRFHSHDPRQKIKKKVHFGPTLDLKPFVSGSYVRGRSEIYSLWGFGSRGLEHKLWPPILALFALKMASGTISMTTRLPRSEKRVLEQQAYMFFYVHDRRNIVPRKPPTDVAQKDNLKAKANGNRTSSTFNQGSKETVQNGPVEKQLSSATPAAAIRKDASNGVPSMAPLVKDQFRKTWPVTMAEKGFCSENFSKAPFKQTPQRDFLLDIPGGGALHPIHWLRLHVVGLFTVLEAAKKGANAAAAAKGNINSNGDCLMDVIIDGEFRQRVDEGGTVLAPDKQLDKNSGSSSSLLSNQWEAGRSDGPKDSKREVMQNGLMSMLTRGLEETVVSHWDGIELPPCQTAASNDVESTSIGLRTR